MDRDIKDGRGDSPRGEKRERKKPNPSRVIYMNKLPHLDSSREIYEYASRFGMVVKAQRLSYVRAAFVEFDDFESAERFYRHAQKEGVRIADKLVNVEYSTKQSLSVLKSPRTRDSPRERGRERDRPSFFLAGPPPSSRERSYSESYSRDKGYSTSHHHSPSSRGLSQPPRSSRHHALGPGVREVMLPVLVYDDGILQININSPNWPRDVHIPSLHDDYHRSRSHAPDSPYMRSSRYGPEPSSSSRRGEDRYHPYRGPERSRYTPSPEAYRRDDERMGPKVLMVNNIYKTCKPSDLAKLIGCYADVLRVKYIYKKQDSAFVVVRDETMARRAIDYLTDQPVFADGQTISISFSRHQELMPFQGGDYEIRIDHSDRCHRYLRGGQRELKSLSIPSNLLHISNIPAGTPDEELQDLFTGCITFKKFSGKEPPRGSSSRPRPEMGYAKFEDTHTACAALMEHHGRSFNGSRLRVSFSRPSNWTKTKTSDRRNRAKRQEPAPVHDEPVDEREIQPDF